MTPPMSCELAHRHDPGQAQCIDEGQTHGALMVEPPFRVIKCQFGYVQGNTVI